MKKIPRIGIGGPVGSGKTAIIEAITPILVDLGKRVLVVTNDVVTTEDAKHVQRTLRGILHRGPDHRRRDRRLSAHRRARGSEHEPRGRRGDGGEVPRQRPRAARERRRQPDADLQPGADRLLHLRHRRRRRRQDPAQERPRHLAVRHPRHQQDRPRALRRRQPRGHGPRLAADARQQALRLHQLQDRRGHRRRWCG